MANNAFAKAEAILKSGTHANAQYFELVQLAQDSGDERIRWLIEGFIVSAPPGWRIPTEDSKPTQEDNPV